MENDEESTSVPDAEERSRSTRTKLDSHRLSPMSSQHRYSSDETSQGVVESIWDVKEMVPSDEATTKQEQYLCKYRGVAHVHNRWIPESQLIYEAPKLLSEFNMKKQVVWSKEWIVPQRLLLKREITSRNGQGEDTSDCHYEWLVKWTGLGYDHATWELENASFLTSPQAAQLIKEYEMRHDKLFINCSRVDKDGANTISEFSESLCVCSPGNYNQHLPYVKKLCEHYDKGWGAIVLDDQSIEERALKLILFISSMYLAIERPFLIILTSAALSLWEAEFTRVVPLANIVLYTGNKHVRKNIRSLEFYNKLGVIMFDVLLSSIDVVNEDFEDLSCIPWEAVLIDLYQNSGILKHFKRFESLAGKGILLDKCQIKHRAEEYQKILKFLECKGKINLPRTKLDNPHEQLMSYVAYKCKSGSSRFIEYWVPVKLSNVQLEQYCSNLLSSSTLLSSCSKSNTYDPLREIITREIVTFSRKCCDHPNLNMESERSVDNDILASGKLQALEKILLEIKKRGLRVMIFFQSIGGSRKISIGNVLEDFLNHRFGSCYVRIDQAYSSPSKKKALDTFNKETEKFALLIENRACRQKIRLSSVDSIILFGSDWDPLNDLRQLDKITIDFQTEPLKVFRLYSCYTLEEKVLILAKEGLAITTDPEDLSQQNCHLLLSWGASYLFTKLDDFHHGCTSASSLNVCSEELFLDDVLNELFKELPQASKEETGACCKYITKVQHDGVVYRRNIVLHGEKEDHPTGDKSYASFWKTLLDRRSPEWKFLSESARRIQKYCNENEFQTVRVEKMNNKVVNDMVSPAHPKSAWNKKRKRTAVNKGEEFAGSPCNSVGANESPRIPHVVHCPRVPEIRIVCEDQNMQVPEFLPPQEMTTKLSKIPQLQGTVSSKTQKDDFSTNNTEMLDNVQRESSDEFLPPRDMTTELSKSPQLQQGTVSSRTQNNDFSTNNTEMLDKVQQESSDEFLPPREMTTELSKIPHLHGTVSSRTQKDDFSTNDTEMLDKVPIPEILSSNSPLSCMSEQLVNQHEQSAGMDSSLLGSQISEVLSLRDSMLRSQLPSTSMAEHVTEICIIEPEGQNMQLSELQESQFIPPQEMTQLRVTPQLQLPISDIPFSNAPVPCMAELSAGMGFSGQGSQIPEVPSLRDSILHSRLLSTSMGEPFAAVHDNTDRMTFEYSHSHFDHVMEMPYSADPNPLRMEMERIKKQWEQEQNTHKNTLLQWKREIAKKYNLRFQDVDREFECRKKELELRNEKVILHNFLAYAMLLKTQGYSKTSAGSPAPNTLGELHALRGRDRLPAGSPSTPPLQRVNHTSALFSSSIRSHSSPTISLQQNHHQNRVELRTSYRMSH